MQRRSWGAVALALVGVLAGGLAAEPAWAGNPAIDTQLFRPSAFPHHYFQTRGADLPPHLTFSGAFALSYGSEPLAFVAGERAHAVVAHQLTFDLLASASFFERIGVGIALPLFLYQRGEDGGFVPFASYDSFAVGDLRVSPFVVLLRHEGRGVGLALDLTVGAPTAQGGRFAGDAGITFAPRIIVEVVFPWLRGAVNLGYFARENQTFASFTARDAFLFDIAVAAPLWSGGMEAFGELQLATPAADPFGVAHENQFEGRLGVGHRFAGGWFVRGAVGGGLLDGWGTPDWRVVVMAGFSGTLTHGDPDGDGVLGDADGCPDEAEDFDGFEDDDGCPDADNDEDGVPDALDPCPLVAEDRDGFQDADGCPDLDNDGDGVPDSVDRCADEAEDADGFDDADGCPDRDNDGDGIPDVADRCPMAPETPNGVDDDDGCPDGFPVRIEGDRIVLERPIGFAPPDRRRVAPDSFEALEALARFLGDHPEIERVRIEAHTDAEGDADANRAFTQAQAEAVRAHLVALDVAARRLEASGRGEDQPVAPNTEDWGREENRRVEFVLVSP